MLASVNGIANGDSNGIYYPTSFEDRHCKVGEGGTPRGGHVVSKDRDSWLVRMSNYIEVNGPS